MAPLYPVAPTLTAEDQVEKIKLDEIILLTEQELNDNFIRSCSSPKEAQQIIKKIYWEVEKNTGYDVQYWPPKLIDDVFDLNDRMGIYKNRIEGFINRECLIEAQHQDEILSDGIVILAEDETLCNAVASSLVFDFFQVIQIFDRDLRSGEAKEKLDAFRAVRTSAILVCTTTILGYPEFFPPANFFILHAFECPALLENSVAQLTRLSRKTKISSTIWVPLNEWDTRNIVECAATLLAARGEDIEDGFVEWVDQKCWGHIIPGEVEKFYAWSSSVKEANLSRNAEIEKELGIRVEFWWQNFVTMAKVRELVQPTNECQ
ncbi:Protein CBG27499 [Caenorhabditis briggsae]|uniref:Protein CBG27499 n=1 Tax=Caenorhabditis briggsae TaxID=6238 RepID=B6IF14_CAEBR|nr:Protein CBG27499 [Caenorhabditis briggsae]CAR98494.1 Protein CBG27499 [Caenorhabditis briggsae]